jgi:LacI family transcriptional regulator
MRPSGRATIEDVARAAGVAVSTVSRVLNNSDYASATTRKRVLEAARRLNYVANPTARGLRRAETMTIGLLISDLTNPVFMEYIRGAEHEAQAHGYELLIADGQDSPDLQARMLQNLYERRVDGLLLRGPIKDARKLRLFLDEKVPVYPKVLSLHDPVRMEDPRDEAPATAAAFRRLLELGHRCFAYFTRGVSVTRTDRYSVLLQVLAEAGLPESAAIPCEVPRSLDCGQLVRRACIEDGATALIGGSHLVTPHLLIAVREAGLRVPADVSVVSFGDSPWAVAHDPPLSVVTFDHYLAGRLAVQSVLSRLACGVEPPAEPSITARFIERGSCGPAPRR